MTSSPSALRAKAGAPGAKPVLESPAPSAPGAVPSSTPGGEAPSSFQPATKGEAILSRGLSEMLASDTLQFPQVEGNNLNHFLQSEEVACHVISSSLPVLRAVAAFPSGNSNVAFYADPTRAENRGVSLQTEGLEPAKATGRGQAVRYGVRLDGPSLRLTDVVLGSSRASREVLEGGGRSSPPVPGQRPLRSSVQEENGAPTLHLERENLDGGRYTLDLALPKGAKVRRELVDGREEVVLSRADGRPLEFTVRAEVPYAPMKRFPLQKLMRPEAVEGLQRLDGASPTMQRTLLRALQHLQFLVYEEKALAGSWRFHTYFGRDTLLTTMMLMDLLQPEAIEAALASVLERVNGAGQVAHEEDIGAWAERHHLTSSGSTREDAVQQRPVFDYKMVDDDFMLPLLLRRYLVAPGVTEERARDFLAQKTPDGGTRLDAAQRNARFVLEQAELVDGQNPAPIRIPEGEYVGDWRDSEAGLAGGKFPGSINVDLVTNALDALGALSGRFGFPAVPDSARLAWGWVQSRYLVTLSVDELQRRVADTLARPENAELRPFLERQELEPGVTVGDFAQGKAVPAVLEHGLSYFSVSLDAEGEALPVMNSDFVLRMFLGEPTPGEISNALRLLELPYPLGLMTPSGMLVANAALSDGARYTDPRGKEFRLDDILGRNGYHGAVSWAWPESMAQMGLIRLIQHYMWDPAYDGLVDRMNDALGRLRGAVLSAGDLATSELRGFGNQGEAVPYGDPVTLPEEARASGKSETEANAGQYWNTAALPVELAYAQLQRLLQQRELVRRSSSVPFGMDLIAPSTEK